MKNRLSTSLKAMGLRAVCLVNAGRNVAVALLMVILPAATMTPSSLTAQEVSIGLGYTGYHANSARDGTLLSIAYQHSPFFERNGISMALGAAATADSQQDYFIGAGIITTLTMGRNWFSELSFMPGAYFYDWPGNSLGDGFEIRSELAFGYRFSTKTALSLAFSHLSNAGLSSSNPGMNALTLRLHRAF